MVEAIETLFVPVVVYNNKEGKDAELLQRFQEPSWNNPVIRYLDADTKDLIERKDGVWSQVGTAARMSKALQASGAQVPTYLQLLASQIQTNAQQEAVFAMHCYWEGEAMIGGIPGVLDTHSAWLGDKEVVQVRFDPQVVDYRTLLQESRKVECASHVFATTDEQLEIARELVGNQVTRLTDEHVYREVRDTEQKYHLRQTLYRHLPLTVLQSTRLNAYVRQKKSAATIRDLLSPHQVQILDQIKTVYEQNPQALSEFVFPDNDARLSAYQQKLEKALREAM